MKEINSKNYYELLGLKREATRQEIKDAYKSIALVYHPDSNFFSEIIPDKPADTADEIFKRLTAAYNVLMDTTKRQLYDATLPPELPGWDAEKPDVIGRKIASYNPTQPGNCGATSAAFGVFGSRDTIDDSEDEPLDPTITDSMENLLFRERKNIWSRLLSVIGMSA